MYIYNDTTSFTGLVDCDQFQVVISYLFNYYIKINHQLRITGAVTITIHSISFLSPQKSVLIRSCLLPSLSLIHHQLQRSLNAISVLSQHNRRWIVLKVIPASDVSNHPLPQNPSSSTTLCTWFP